MAIELFKDILSLFDGAIKALFMNEFYRIFLVGGIMFCCFCLLCGLKKAAGR